MKAAVIKRKGVFAVEDVPEPICGPDRIKVKIKYCGICGTDPEILEERFGLFKGRPPRQGESGPAVIGHEACGTIVEIGQDCKLGHKVGERVAMNFRTPCGECYYCRNKMPHFCTRAVGATGAYAEYAVYHEADVHHLADTVSWEHAALLEPISVAVHVMDQSNIIPGRSVAILGAGPIGLLTLQLAVKSGATKVMVSELIDFKRDVARKLGADLTIDPVKEDILKVGREFTSGHGFDTVIDASGDLEAARQAIYLADKCGTIVWAAVYAYDKDIPINPFYLYANELSIRSVFTAPYSFTRAMALLPKLELDPIISDILPVEDIQAAFEKHRQGKSIKILLKMY
jgi:2-desacetyl-2-hydroxyethyl bacteriochlorophyllide A dehydrogenase